MKQNQPKKKKKKKASARTVAVDALLAKAPQRKSARAAAPQPSAHFASETFRQGTLPKLQQLAETCREQLRERFLDESGKRRLEWIKKRVLASRAGGILQNWIK